MKQVTFNFVGRYMFYQLQFVYLRLSDAARKYDSPEFYVALLFWVQLLRLGTSEVELGQFLMEFCYSNRDPFSMFDS